MFQPFVKLGFFGTSHPLLLRPALEGCGIHHLVSLHSETLDPTPHISHIFFTEVGNQSKNLLKEVEPRVCDQDERSFPPDLSNKNELQLVKDVLE